MYIYRIGNEIKTFYLQRNEGFIHYVLCKIINILNENFNIMT